MRSVCGVGTAWYTDAAIRQRRQETGQCLHFFILLPQILCRFWCSTSAGKQGRLLMDFQAVLPQKPTFIFFSFTIIFVLDEFIRRSPLFWISQSIASLTGGCLLPGVEVRGGCGPAEFLAIWKGDWSGMNTELVGRIYYSRAVFSCGHSRQLPIPFTSRHFPNEARGAYRPVEDCSSLERAESQSSNTVHTPRIWIDSIPNRQIMSSFHVAQCKLSLFVLFQSLYFCMLKWLNILYSVSSHNRATTANTEIKTMACLSHLHDYVTQALPIKTITTLSS